VMPFTTGVLLFDDAEELDFAGPWEVFTMARMEGDRVVTIAERDQPIRAAKGLRVLPDHTLADAPPLDVLVVPGGEGTRREVENPAVLDWIKSAAANCTWVTSVCTGSYVLHAAGLVADRQVTTHWGFVDQLREQGNVTVLENVRYVRDGNVVTAAGVSAGIDMSPRVVQRLMEYDPAPPYAAEV
jgi:transcriptional regulator GlxA family with amidase domain